MLTCPSCKAKFTPTKPFENEVEVFDCPACSKALGIVIGTVEMVSDIFKTMKDVAALRQELNALRDQVASLASTLVARLGAGVVSPYQPSYPNAGMPVGGTGTVPSPNQLQTWITSSTEDAAVSAEAYKRLKNVYEGKSLDKKSSFQEQTSTTSYRQ